MEKNKFLGTWKLVEFITLLDQSTYYPFGTNPSGFLIYTPHLVSVQFMNANRTKYNSDDFKALNLHEKAEMADNFGGYVGRYEIKGNVIIHYPEVCSIPNYINVPQKREFTLNGDLLTFEYKYPGSDENSNKLSRVSWMRYA